MIARDALQKTAATEDTSPVDRCNVLPEAMALKSTVGITVTIAIVLSLFGPARGHAGSSLAGSAQEAKPQHEKPPRIVSVNAKDFEFDPVVIHMKVNERVELDVMSEDRDHGIRISPFPDGAKANTAPGLSFSNGEDCWKLKKGEVVAIGVVPTEPGTYTFSCCKACGNGHKKMKGQIIVGP
jgi:cytochrome c oxidase subunit 2